MNEEEKGEASARLRWVGDEGGGGGTGGGVCCSLTFPMMLPTSWEGNKSNN